MLIASSARSRPSVGPTDGHEVDRDEREAERDVVVVAAMPNRTQELVVASEEVLCMA